MQVNKHSIVLTLLIIISILMIFALGCDKEKTENESVKEIFDSLHLIIKNKSFNYRSTNFKITLFELKDGILTYRQNNSSVVSGDGVYSWKVKLRDLTAESTSVISTSDSKIKHVKVDCNNATKCVLYEKKNISYPNSKVYNSKRDLDSILFTFKNPAEAQFFSIKFPELLKRYQSQK